MSVCLSGGLSVAVEGPSKAEIRCADNADDTYTVTYYPMIAGTYSIAVQFAGEHIAGSPFTAHVIPPGIGCTSSSCCCNVVVVVVVVVSNDSS